LMAASMTRLPSNDSRATSAIRTGSLLCIRAGPIDARNLLRGQP
jgi:hypothetical protein